MADPPDELSFIDLDTPAGFRVGDETAMSKRPWRLEFFEVITRRLDALAAGQPRVLELGSGAGFLARYVLEQLPSLPHYVLLDGSSHNHALARERVAHFVARASFLERDLRQSSWSADLGPFDAVVTMHTAEELRGKRPVTALHQQARSVLSPQGVYLWCERESGAEPAQEEPLAPASAELQGIMREAGFGRIERLAQRGAMALYQAR